MDCCNGKNYTTYGKFYKIEDDNTSDLCYCQYCYDNDCIEGNLIELVKSSNKQYNCDCPKQDEHKVVKPLICPTCQVKTPAFMLATCGCCRDCGSTIPYIAYKYCDVCSYIIEKCRDCGKDIEDGNSYVSKIEKFIIKQIEKKKLYLGDALITESKFLKYQNEFLETINEARNKFSGKTRDQVLEIIKNDKTN